MQKRGVCQGGKGGVLALAPPSAGVLPAGRWTERGRPKAAPWGTIFPDPISFDSAKRNGGKSHPGFSGQGFALRRVSFCAHKKKSKMRRRSGAEELQAPRARFRSQRLHPRTPVFTRVQDKECIPLRPARKVRTPPASFSAAAHTGKDGTLSSPRECAWRGGDLDPPFFHANASRMSFRVCSAWSWLPARPGEQVMHHRIPR